MPVDGVILNNVRIRAARPLTCRDANGISFAGVFIETPAGTQTDCEAPRTR